MTTAAQPAAPPDPWARLAPVALALAVGAAWRAAFLFWTEFSIEADEAVLGLMAKHIAEAREFPILYWGQEYMGAVEAYAASFLVALLGTKPVALKLTALAFGLLHAGTGAALAERIFGRGVKAAVAALYLAAAPLFLTLWSLKLRCAISTMALGQVVLLLALRAGTSGATRRGMSRPSGAGTTAHCGRSLRARPGCNFQSGRTGWPSGASASCPRCAVLERRVAELEARVRELE